MVTKQTKKVPFDGSHSVVVAQDLQLALENRDFSPVNYAICLRTLLQNWRQGTVGCKGRADVAFSNKKPWKQKGTGRARAGSARSPLWRKGGVTFGPQPRTRELRVTQVMRQQAMMSLLCNKLEKNNIISLDFLFNIDKPSTKQAYNALAQAQLHNKKVVFFVNPQDAQAHDSFANIPTVKILFFDQPNVYDLSDGNYWIFLKKDINSFKEMVNKWI